MNFSKIFKLVKSIFLFAIFSNLSSVCAASEPSFSSPQNFLDTANYKVGAGGKTIEIINATDRTVLKSCKMDKNILRARLTTDGRALLVSGNGFVDLENLASCGEKKIQVKTTPDSSGLLEDVNVKKSLYLSLVPVTSGPASYLAIVGNLGSSKNIVSLPGALFNSNSMEKQQRQGFSYSDDLGPFAMISPDGRYVAPSGVLDCSRDAYPGVWDIKNNIKVSFDGNRRERSALCGRLFLSGEKS